MQGFRLTRTKAFIAIAALEMLVEEFDADPMIHSLYELCALALKHPKFNTPGYPGDREYEWADVGLNLLFSLFFDSHLFAEGEAPRFEVDSRRGVIVMTSREARAKKAQPGIAPALCDATKNVRPRLAKRFGAGN